MTKLTRTTITHRTGDITVVGFDTDDGAVDLELWDDGYTELQVGHKEASVDEVRAILDDVADSEHFPAAAEKIARDILAAAADDEPDEEVDSDEDVIHITEDGTEVRVGDKVNHPGGWSYEIVGRENDATVEKMDFHDGNTAVTISTLEDDIREHGFAERAEGGC